MRRKEKEILDREEIESIIKKADVCRLGLSVDNIPYIVPLNFGYRDRCIFFHTAKAGKKIDMIKTNNRVCFELDIDHEVVRAENPCDWNMKFQSVIGYGRAFLLEDIDDKRLALDIIVEHYSGRVNEYKEKMVEHLAVIKVQIESMTGKSQDIDPSKAYISPKAASNTPIIKSTSSRVIHIGGLIRSTLA